MKLKRDSILFRSVLLAIVFILVGLVLIRIIFERVMRQTLQEHDEAIVTMVDLVDHTLAHNFDHLQKDMLDFQADPSVSEGEEELIQTGDAGKLEKAIAENDILSANSMEAVLAFYDGKLVCQTEGDFQEMSSCGDTNEDGIMVCYDKRAEEEVYYLCFRQKSEDGQIEYWGLIGMENIYTMLIDEKVIDRYWVVFYNEEAEVFTQNHNNQPGHTKLTKEEALERKDGYSIMVEGVMNNQRREETYEYTNPGGTFGEQRILVNPVKFTKNQNFSIAIAQDSRILYENNRRNMTQMMVLVVLIFGGCIVLIVSHILLERDVDMKLMEAEHDAEIKEIMQKAKLKNSISQMQPHFLYNALSSIREVVMDDPEYASQLIYDFTVHLRACIKSMSDEKPISFEQELENVEAYLNIEKMRLGEKLTVEYDIQAKDFEIVPLTVQPMIENAVKHGIHKRGRQGGTVRLSTKETDDCYQIRIQDNGIGFDQQKIQKEIESGERDSTGMQNVSFRISKIQGGRIKVHSIPGKGTEVLIEIPKKRERETL